MSATSFPIDRRSTVPFYVQLKQALTARMAAGDLAPGERMPGELALCSDYDVSRTVVRQALLELEHEGLIRREKGRGTFVEDPHTSRGIGSALSGRFEDIQSGVGEQHSRVVRRGVVAATAAVARDLSLGAGTHVVEIERVREVDGLPWAFTVTQLPLDVGAPLLEAELEDISLFGILERQFGIRFDHAERFVEAAIASEDVARSIGADPGAPVLVMHSLSFDQQGRPIERFTGFHRGDRSRLDIRVTRDANTEI